MNDDVTEQLAGLRVDPPTVSADLGDVERRAGRIRVRRRATQGAVMAVALLIIGGGIMLRGLGSPIVVSPGPADRPDGASKPSTERAGESGPGALAMREFPDGSWVAVTSHRAVPKPSGSIICLAEVVVVQGAVAGAAQTATSLVSNAWGEPPWVAPVVLSGSGWSWPVVLVVGVTGRLRAVFADGTVDEVEVSGPHALLVGRAVHDASPTTVERVEHVDASGVVTPIRLAEVQSPTACGPDSYPGGRSATGDDVAAADEVLRTVFGPRPRTGAAVELVTGLVEPPADDLLDAFTRGPWMSVGWTVETWSHRITGDGHLWVRVHLAGFPVVEQSTGLASDRWVELVSIDGRWKVTRRSVCEMISVAGIQCTA